MLVLKRRGVHYLLVFIGKSHRCGLLLGICRHKGEACCHRAGNTGPKNEISFPSGLILVSINMSYPSFCFFVVFVLLLISSCSILILGGTLRSKFNMDIRVTWLDKTHHPQSEIMRIMTPFINFLY